MIRKMSKTILHLLRRGKVRQIECKCVIGYFYLNFAIHFFSEKRSTSTKKYSKASGIQVLERTFEREAKLREKELELKKMELDLQRWKLEQEQEERKQRLELELEERRSMLDLLKETSIAI